MSENASRQQQLYWNQLVELKVACEYVQLYRDRLGNWVTGLNTLKAIASAGSIAGWAIWKDYAFAWGIVIALAQVTDALKDVFPFAKIYKSASDYAMVLRSLFIDAQLEWDNISLGRFSDDEIALRTHKLRKLQLEAEQRSFPQGLNTNSNLFRKAQDEARLYFDEKYRVN
jgi:hypothetical protein